MDLYGITSQRQLAQIIGVTQGAVHKWIHGARPPVELAVWAGVSYDWLIGRSPEIWSHEMLSLRRLLREKFSSDEYSVVMSPSTRFRLVATWALEQGTFITKQTLSTFLRIEEETLDMILSGKLNAEWATILRLAEYLDIPKEWFEDGSSRRLRIDRYEAVVKRLIDERIDPDDIMRIIDAIVSTRTRSI